jgi:hypothetical protein
MADAQTFHREVVRPITAARDDVHALVSLPKFYRLRLGPVDNQQVQMKAAESATNDENRSESLS